MDTSSRAAKIGNAISRSGWVFGEPWNKMQIALAHDKGPVKTLSSQKDFDSGHALWVDAILLQFIAKKTLFMESNAWAKSR